MADFENHNKFIKQQTDELYKVNNRTYWKYALTCFKSCVTMVPKSAKDKLKEDNLSNPNEPLKFSASYDQELFSKKDISCLKACSNKLGYLDARKIEYDSELEKEAVDNKEHRVLSKIPKPKNQEIGVTNLEQVFNKNLNKIQQKTLIEIQSFMAERRNKEFLNMVNEISQDCSHYCHDYRTLSKDNDT